MYLRQLKTKFHYIFGEKDEIKKMNKLKFRMKNEIFA